MKWAAILLISTQLWAQDYWIPGPEKDVIPKTLRTQWVKCFSKQLTPGERITLKLEKAEITDVLVWAVGPGQQAQLLLTPEDAKAIRGQHFVIKANHETRP